MSEKETEWLKKKIEEDGGLQKEKKSAMSEKSRKSEKVRKKIYEC